MLTVSRDCPLVIAPLGFSQWLFYEFWRSRLNFTQFRLKYAQKGKIKDFHELFVLQESWLCIFQEMKYVFNVSNNFF